MMGIQPTAARADLPRYSQAPFPPYRHVPGVTPHPRRDRGGHSFGKPEPSAAHLPPEEWRANDLYLFGIDLYNYAYWWECHEALEALWRAAGRTFPQAQFYQGIIQVAAANLQRFLGRVDVAARLFSEGLERLRAVSQKVYMGVDVPDFRRRAPVEQPYAVIELRRWM